MKSIVNSNVDNLQILMGPGKNITNKNDNLKEYLPLKSMWEAKASGAPDKVLADAKNYLKNLPALIGTGPFAAVILDLQRLNLLVALENSGKSLAWIAKKA